MARVKGAMMARKRRNKTLKLAKGYWGAKSKHFKMANEQVMKSLTYAYVGRRLKKRDFRQLWITRISAGCQGPGYELFQLHARSEGRRHPDQPQDAVRDGDQRHRGVRRPVRHRQEGHLNTRTAPCSRGAVFFCRNVQKMVENAARVWYNKLY